MQRQATSCVPRRRTVAVGASGHRAVAASGTERRAASASRTEPLSFSSGVVDPVALHAASDDGHLPESSFRLLSTSTNSSWESVAEGRFTLRRRKSCEFGRSQLAERLETSEDNQSRSLVTDVHHAGTSRGCAAGRKFIVVSGGE